MILRSMQRQLAHASAAVSVAELGKMMAAHLGRQPIVVSSEQTESSWISFSSQVRSLCAMEKGLQYVSIIRDGVTLFHVQRGGLGSDKLISEEEMQRAASTVHLHRGLLDIGLETIPVVLFSREVMGEDGKLTTVEVAIKRDTVERERMTSEYAIAQMFKVALVTIVISFALCILLVVWMMRAEHLRELGRREEEHLAFAGVMANGIVHDFRNPMSSLKLDVQMMARETEKEEGSDSVKIQTLAERARKTIDRMDKVFEEFLYVSKPPSDAREALDVCSCVRECLTILEARVLHAGTKLTSSIPEGPVNVLVYRASFHRAVMNVILNAEQFVSGIEGEISVTVFSSDRNAIVEVMDNGPGVKDADQDRIFEMFESGRPNGTGLGLFLARAAIESSEGEISVRNRENGGACFRIEVPLADEGEV